MTLRKICTSKRSIYRFHSTACSHNSNRTAIVRFGRQLYERMYPVLLVRADGSTIKIRYKEPKRVLMMPIDITTLSEEQKKARSKRREVKKTVQQSNDDFEDDFKVDDYSKFWKN
ncbi:large ribosomal subunit protein mL55 isoform X2 [Conger conger]|uniref:large ribosomal subunit protein mL55 isoform X2 n=1 Tax=Conger conger TaxID=82655 RepID=UPI002A5AAB48|nr:large ribosomal subunit protein mL55 isoform X2 [Conger conger]